jgi:hypothetical protein
MGTVAIEPVIEELQDGSRELRATGCLLLVGQPAALSFDGEQTADDRDRFEAARPVALQRFEEVATHVRPASDRSSLGKGNEDVAV